MTTRWNGVERSFDAWENEQARQRYASPGRPHPFGSQARKECSPMIAPRPTDNIVQAR